MSTPLREAASRAALDEAGILITDLSSSDRRAVQNIISNALYDGWTPAKTAARIEQVVGLTKRDMMAVVNHRARAVKEGKSSHAADQSASAYARRLRKRRARVIAEYEVRKTYADAQRQQWAQDQHDGKISNRAVRVFKTRAGCCSVCKRLNGRRISLRSSQPSVPMHPNCRCEEVLKDDGVVKGTTEPTEETLKEEVAKVRRVRTVAGMRRYNLPIGSPIVPTMDMPKTDGDKLHTGRGNFILDPEAEPIKLQEEVRELAYRVYSHQTRRNLGDAEKTRAAQDNSDFYNFIRAQRHMPDDMHIESLKPGSSDPDAAKNLGNYANRLYGVSNSELLAEIAEAQEFMGEYVPRGYSPVLVKPKPKKKLKRGSITFDPDARTLDPPEQDAIEKLYNYKSTDRMFEARVDSVIYAFGQVKLSGSIWDQNPEHANAFGDEVTIGWFTRTIDLKTGEVKHDLYGTEKGGQGQGIMEEWFGHVLRQYADNELHTVRTQANIDVGGYAWARKGFDWNRPPNKVVNTVLALSKSRDVPKWISDQANDFMDRWADGEHISAKEFSEWGRQEWIEGDRWEPSWDDEGDGYKWVTNLGELSTIERIVYPEDHRSGDESYDSGSWASGYHLGKAIMLGSTWDGVLHLGDIEKALSGAALLEEHLKWVTMMERTVVPYTAEQTAGKSDVGHHYIDLLATPEDEVLLDQPIKKSRALDRSFRHKGLIGQDGRHAR